MSDPLVGQVLGDRYRIEARLGGGGMGTVYRAHHLALDRPVAVKLLHDRLTRDASVAKRFDREALAASKLDHPNCVRVFDAGTTESGTKYLVMELLEGRELLQPGEGRVAVARAVELTQQILRGLDHAHRRGLVHRDLKPENIYIVRDDEDRELVKIVDFGIVKLLGGDGSGEALTRAGLVFGTPRYMSPEQVAGGRVDERADLYAVGVLLHEMLAGAPPFDADEPGILLRMHLIADPPELPDDVPAPLRGLVARLLAKDAKDRPASAREAREELLRAVEPGSVALAPMHPTTSGVAPTFADAPATAVGMLPSSGTFRTVIAPAAVVRRAPAPTRAPIIGWLVAFVGMALVVGSTTLRLSSCDAAPMPAEPAATPPPAAPAMGVGFPAFGGTSSPSAAVADDAALASDDDAREHEQEEQPELRDKPRGKRHKDLEKERKKRAKRGKHGKHDD